MKKIGIVFLIFLVSYGMVFAEGGRDRGGAQAALGEAYPTRPVRFIFPYAAGTTNEVYLRILTPTVERIIGQPIPIINIAGAAGNIGMTELMNSPADGYTMALDIINIWTRKALGTSDFGPEAFELLAQ
jgi:tripartite-type tricarboxylate transporter receptor subunit TctC